MRNISSEMRAIWNCAFAMKYKGIYKYWLWFLFSLTLIVPFSSWYITKNIHNSIGSISIPFSILFTSAWLPLLSGSVRQNSAANARLVPHLHTRLIQLVSAFALLGITVASYFFSFFYPSFGWCFVSLLLYTIGSGWAHGRQFGWPIAMIVLTHRIIIDSLPSNISTALTSDTAFFMWLALGLLLGALFIKFTFPHGGDRSWQIQLRALNQVMQTKDPFAIPKDASSLTFIPYNRALQAACAKHSRNLAVLVLGPNLHWGALLSQFLFVIIGAILLKTLLIVFPASNLSGFFSGFGKTACCILIIMQLTAQNAAIQFSKTRTEQSLYRLSAFAISSKLLNQRLAFGLVRSALQGFFLTWGVALMCSLIIDPSYNMMVIITTICTLTLPFVCLYLRDYSREVMMNAGYAKAWQYLGIFIMPSAVIFMLTISAPLSAWLIIAASSIVLSAILITYRWRKMIAAPVAFPAGRIEM